ATGELDSFTVYGHDYPTPDGTCLRDYVHVLDIAQAHICALERMDQPGIRAFNIGLGESYSVRQICRAVEQVTGKSIPVRVGPRRPGDPPVLCASPRRIMDELGWRPKRSALDEIIGSAWRWKKKATLLARSRSSSHP